MSPLDWVAVVVIVPLALWLFLSVVAVLLGLSEIARSVFDSFERGL